MNSEPGNHSVVIDRDGDTWVRFDEWPGWIGYNWRHISTGNIWDERARNQVGSARAWYLVQEHEPLVMASPDVATDAVAQVERAWRADR